MVAIGLPKFPDSCLRGEYRKNGFSLRPTLISKRPSLQPRPIYEWHVVNTRWSHSSVYILRAAETQNLHTVITQAITRPRLSRAAPFSPVLGEAPFGALTGSAVIAHWPDACFRFIKV